MAAATCRQEARASPQGEKLMTLFLLLMLLALTLPLAIDIMTDDDHDESAPRDREWW